MTDNEQTISSLNELQSTTEILLDSLLKADDDKAFEAISVMLMQGMTLFGAESPFMQQCFPVWDAIKTHIDDLDFEMAIGQTKVWQSQLEEIISIVQKGPI